jgi:hypothetical protein
MINIIGIMNGMALTLHFKCETLIICKEVIVFIGM